MPCSAVFSAQTTFHFEFMQNIEYLWGPLQGRRTISALSESVSFPSRVLYPLGMCKLLTISASSPLLINLFSLFDGCWKKITIYFSHVSTAHKSTQFMLIANLLRDEKNDGKNMHRSAGQSSNNQRHCPDLSLYFKPTPFASWYWKIYYRPLWQQKGQKSKYY